MLSWQCVRTGLVGSLEHMAGSAPLPLFVRCMAACRCGGLNPPCPATLIPKRCTTWEPSPHPAPPPCQVVAFDRSHAKAAEVRRLAESFGLTCVKAYRMDATKSVLQPGPARPQQPGEGQAPAAADGGQPDGEAADGDTAAAGGSRGRRGGPTQPVSEATLRRLERIAAARRARGLEAPPSAHTAEGKEAVTRGFPPESFDYVLCDAPCTALGLRPR